MGRHRPLPDGRERDRGGEGPAGRLTGLPLGAMITASWFPSSRAGFDGASPGTLMREIAAVPPDALSRRINLTDEDVRLYVDGEAVHRAHC